MASGNWKVDQAASDPKYECCYRFKTMGKHSETCKNTQCHTCKEYGHVGYACPKSQCKACKEWGHGSLRCPNQGRSVAETEKTETAKNAWAGYAGSGADSSGGSGGHVWSKWNVLDNRAMSAENKATLVAAKKDDEQEPADAWAPAKQDRGS